jgi:hypothetical protein
LCDHTVKNFTAALTIFSLIQNKEFVAMPEVQKQREAKRRRVNSEPSTPDMNVTVHPQKLLETPFEDKTHAKYSKQLKQEDQTYSVKKERKYSIPIPSDVVKQIQQKYSVPVPLVNVKNEYSIPIPSVIVKQENQTIKTHYTVPKQRSVVPVPSVTVKQERRESTQPSIFVPVPSDSVSKLEQQQKKEKKYSIPIPSDVVKQKQQQKYSVPVPLVNVKNEYSIPIPAVIVKQEIDPVDDFENPYAHEFLSMFEKEGLYVPKSIYDRKVMCTVGENIHIQAGNIHRLTPSTYIDDNVINLFRNEFNPNRHVTVMDTQVTHVILKDVRRVIERGDKYKFDTLLKKKVLIFPICQGFVIIIIYILRLIILFQSALVCYCSCWIAVFGEQISKSNNRC